MNQTELNVAMLRKNTNAAELAKAIRKSRVSFNKKRRGEVPFSLSEVLVLSKELELTIDEVSVIFFDGHLRKRNSEPASSS